jgi:ribonuclease PH
MDMIRVDGRQLDQLRPLKMTDNFLMHPAGSVLIETGDTKVVCTACVEEKTAPHLKGTGKGWVTAEYSMLPAATATRNKRDISKLKLSPRSTEIQRLIGRSLRAAVDMEKLGERSIIIDCDVISADGGTRCASITGGFIALALACNKLLKEGVISENPIVKQVAAVSVGVLEGEILCDLEYVEDSRAEVDMNVVMTSEGDFVELQGTAEHEPFGYDALESLLALARKGLKKIFTLQKNAVNG